MTKSRKELLNAPDEFLTTSGNIALWIKTNPRRFISMIVILAVIVATIAGFYTWHSTREDSSMAAFFSTARDSQALKGLAEEYDDTRAGKLALLSTAALAYEQGDPSGTVALSERFINAWGTEDLFYWQALLLMAHAYTQLEEHEKALPLYETCMQQAPEDIRNQARYYKGTLLKDLGRDQESRELLLGVSGAYRTRARIALAPGPGVAGEPINAE